MQEAKHELFGLQVKDERCFNYKCMERTMCVMQYRMATVIIPDAPWVKYLFACFGDLFEIIAPSVKYTRLIITIIINIPNWYKSKISTINDKSVTGMAIILILRSGLPYDSEIFRNIFRVYL
jgi:hypothetical protein